MLIIVRKDGEPIEKALRRYRRKYKEIQIRKELKRRREFTKPSVVRRKELLKAMYINAKQTENG